MKSLGVCKENPLIIQRKLRNAKRKGKPRGTITFYALRFKEVIKAV